MQDSKMDRIGKFCYKHNQPNILVDAIRFESNCAICLQEKTGLMTIEAQQQRFNEIINQEKDNYNKNKLLFKNICNSIIAFRNSLIMSLDKILQVIQDSIKIIDQSQEKLQQRIQQQQFPDIIIKLIFDDYWNNQWRYEQLRNQIKELLEQFQNNYLNFDPLINWKNIECQIVEESKNKNDYQNCCAVAFNKESNILIVSCQQEIIVNLFRNGVLVQELQRLSNHKGQVKCLYFMKRSYSFVSAGQDDTIIIWEFNNNINQWFAKYLLKENVNDVTCILMNKSENMLISNAQHQIMKVWKKINNSWNCHQTIDAQQKILAISLNEFENKLIACGSQNNILVFEKENDINWMIAQTINVSSNGSKLCFTMGNQFIFFPQNGDQLQVYSYDQDKGLFKISQQVYITQQSDNTILFPCQFIKQFRMIVVKHGKYLYILKINQAGNYQLVQSIEFSSNKIFGRLTDDGQYLVTWDEESCEIQVRKFKFLK